MHVPLQREPGPTHSSLPIPPQAQPRRSSLPAFLALIAIAAVAVVFALPLGEQREEKPAHAEPMVPPPPPPPPPPAVAAPEKIKLAIIGEPEGAKVLGPGGLVLGSVPITLELLRSTEPMQLRIEAEGYLPHDARIVPQADGTLSIALEAKRTKPSKKKPNPTKGKDKDGLEVPDWAKPK